MTTRITDIVHTGFERVVKVENEEAHLYGFVAVHNTNLGPGLGGIRCTRYPTGDAALADVLELASAMTLKSSLAGINYGGGKSVMMYLDGMNRVAAYSALGEVVDRLDGIYLAVGDVGTSTDDLKVVQQHTRHCYGADLDSGIPTAEGLQYALMEYCDFYSINYKDLTVSISGLGKVGGHLAKLLAQNGAELTLADVSSPMIEALLVYFSSRLHLKMPKFLYGEGLAHQRACEVFSPCALGHEVNKDSRMELNCNAVIGSANNPLDSLETARFLHNRGILYLPDFLVNAGGVIALACEIEDRMEDLPDMLSTIGDRVEDLLYEEGAASPLTIATKMAWDRVDNGD